MTLTWLHSWAGDAGEGVASSDRTLLPTGGQWRNRTKRKQKILHPALLRGKEWCGHHLLKSRIQRLRVARLRDAACPGASRAWQGRRRAAPVSCSQLHAAAVVQAAVVAELEAAGGRPRRRADGGAAVGWRWGGDSSGPPGQDVTKRLRLLLCGGELLGKVLQRLTLADMRESDKHRFLDSPISQAGLFGEAVLVGLPHIRQGQPQVALLDH